MAISWYIKDVYLTESLEYFIHKAEIVLTFFVTVNIWPSVGTSEQGVSVDWIAYNKDRKKTSITSSLLPLVDIGLRNIWIRDWSTPAVWRWYRLF